MSGIYSPWSVQPRQLPSNLIPPRPSSTLADKPGTVSPPVPVSGTPSNVLPFVRGARL